MKTSHTPGPWNLVYDEKGLELGGGTEQYTCVFSSAGFGIVASVIYKKTGILGDSKTLQYNTFEANAKLIAAAPDLLEALEYCVSVFEAQLDQNESYYKQAVKAIKKATE